MDDRSKTLRKHRSLWRRFLQPGLLAIEGLTPSRGVVHAAQIAGLLYVARNVAQVLASYPIGVWADRIDSLPLLVVGYALGVLTAASMGAAFWLDTASVPLLAGIFVVAGLYVAIQEARESTVTADMVSRETRNELQRAGHRQRWRRWREVPLQRHRRHALDGAFANGRIRPRRCPNGRRHVGPVPNVGYRSTRAQVRRNRVRHEDRAKISGPI